MLIRGSENKNRKTDKGDRSSEKKKTCPLCLGTGAKEKRGYIGKHEVKEKWPRV